MKRLPIKAAKDLAKAYDQAQVLLVTWDAKSNLMHSVSYGKTAKDCEQAVMGMNLIRKTLGFPEDACRLLPYRVAADYDRAEGALGMREGQIPDPSLHHMISNHRLAGIVAWGLRQLGLEPK
jgi:hypothetical protein